MKIEVCCGSYEDALEAYKGGAERVELCSDLFFGGLTSSLGTYIKTRENTRLDISVMIRPRQSGFCYSQNEFDLMLLDADIFVKNGVDSIVFGFLNSDGSINYERCKAMAEVAAGKAKCVFHKAFDVANEDLMESAVKLREAGVDRILTAGKCKTALEGAENIKKLMTIGGIDILPAGNIRVHNLKELYEKTNCSWVHTSAFDSHTDASAYSDKIFFTDIVLPAQGEYKRVNSNTVRNIVKFGRSL